MLSNRPVTCGINFFNCSTCINKFIVAFGALSLNWLKLLLASNKFWEDDFAFIMEFAVVCVVSNNDDNIGGVAAKDDDRAEEEEGVTDCCLCLVIS